MTTRLRGERWANVGQKIRKIRKFRGAPLKELAELFGLNSTAVYLGYEVGKSSWTPDMLIKIADYLEVDIGVLTDNSQEIEVEDFLGKKRKIVVEDLENVNVVLDLAQRLPLVDEKLVNVFIDFAKKIMPEEKSEDLPLALKAVKQKSGHKQNNAENSNIKQNDNVDKLDNILSINKVLENQLLDELDVALKDPVQRRKTIRKVNRFYNLIRKVNKVSTEEKVFGKY